MAGHNDNQTPLLQTYWLPRNSQEAAAANFFAWILFAACVLFTIYLTMTFGA
ncbi:MAG TPA: hypothetical protein GXX34_00125 [Clostridia bacterium]|nr:hypothetical protein [Clostridia bacterium]